MVYSGMRMKSWRRERSPWVPCMHSFHLLLLLLLLLLHLGLHSSSSLFRCDSISLDLLGSPRILAVTPVSEWVRLIVSGVMLSPSPSFVSLFFFKCATHHLKHFQILTGVSVWKGPKQFGGCGGDDGIVFRFYLALWVYFIIVVIWEAL